jgi:hypothetical protein
MTELRSAYDAANTPMMHGCKAREFIGFSGG